MGEGSDGGQVGVHVAVALGQAAGEGAGRGDGSAAQGDLRAQRDAGTRGSDGNPLTSHEVPPRAGGAVNLPSGFAGQGGAEWMFGSECITPGQGMCSTGQHHIYVQNKTGRSDKSRIP